MDELKGGELSSGCRNPHHVASEYRGNRLALGATIQELGEGRTI